MDRASAATRVFALSHRPGTCALARSPKTFAYRFRWTACAAATRSRIVLELSPAAPLPRVRTGTAPTVTRMSTRSSSGPERRERYRATSAGVQVHALAESPACPHGHGFIAATSVNLAG